jgi:hypothetical protein
MLINGGIAETMTGGDGSNIYWGKRVGILLNWGNFTPVVRVERKKKEKKRSGS